MTTTQEATSDYPIAYNVDYPERPLNRATTFFRILMVIPITIVLWLVGNAYMQSDNSGFVTAASAGGILFLAPLLLILFRQKYPKWWFDWNLEFLRFSNRVSVYFALLRDEYPSTDEQQALHLDIRYPDAKFELNRFMPLVKWLLAIPHYIVLFFLSIGAVVSVIIAWFAILFTGTYPRGLFNFVVGVMRWNARVVGYMGILVTDKYPPFSLK